MERRRPSAGAGPDDATVADGPASRRDVLKIGAAALAAGSLRLRLPAPADAQEAVSPPAEICVLTPNLTEGPYYVEGQLVRRDITEGKPGVPLALRIAVQDITACTPLANAAVELWHCDAQGYYSGIVGENPGGGGETTGEENAATTFLRGIQVADADGTVEFATIYPGWYTGRTVHIHMKVHVDGSVGDAASDEAAVAAPAGGETYQGGHTAHVGQLFFADAVTAEVFTDPAYARAAEDGRLTNDEDNIFGNHGDEPGFLLALTGSVADGYLGEITVGVDPTAVAAEGGTDGGAGGRPPGGGPPPEGGPPPGDPGGTPPTG